MSSEALRLLQGQSWPGNVRELQNVVERALILACGEGTIRPAHLMLGGGVGRVRNERDRTHSLVRAVRGF